MASRISLIRMLSSPLSFFEQKLILGHNDWDFDGLLTKKQTREIIHESVFNHLTFCELQNHFNYLTSRSGILTCRISAPLRLGRYIPCRRDG